MLVATFSGWNDAASAASAALGAIAESLETELVAQIDPEEFFDFQAARPQIELTEGRLRGVELAREPGRRRAQPRRRARPAADQRHRAEHPLAHLLQPVLDIAERCGVESMVTFGSLIADVAHTRPVPITGLATTRS